MQRLATIAPTSFGRKRRTTTLSRGWIASRAIRAITSPRNSSVPPRYRCGVFLRVLYYRVEKSEERWRTMGRQALGRSSARLRQAAATTGHSIGLPRGGVVRSVPFSLYLVHIFYAEAESRTLPGILNPVNQERLTRFG